MFLLSCLPLLIITLVAAADLTFLYPKYNEWIPIPQRECLLGSCLLIRRAEPMPLEDRFTLLSRKIHALQDLKLPTLLTPVLQDRVERISNNINELHLEMSRGWHRSASEYITQDLVEVLEKLERSVDHIVYCHFMFEQLQIRDEDPLMIYGWAIYSGLISFLDAIKYLHVEADKMVMIHLVNSVAKLRGLEHRLPVYSNAPFSLSAALKATMAPILEALRQEDLESSVTEVLVENLLDAFKSYFATKVYEQGNIDQLMQYAQMFNYQSIIFYREDENSLLQRFKLICRFNDFDLFVRLSTPIPSDERLFYVMKVTGIAKPSDWWTLPSSFLIQQWKSLGLLPVGPFYDRPLLPDLPEGIRVIASRLHEYQRHVKETCWMRSAVKLLSLNRGTDLYSASQFLD